MSSAAPGEPTPATPVSGGSGRDVRGRFQKGNAASRGNGTHKRVAKFRAKLFSSVTLAHFAEIVGVVVREAKAGEKWACELAFAYLCGPPQPLDLLEKIEELERAVAGIGTTAGGGV